MALSGRGRYLSAALYRHNLPPSKTISAARMCCHNFYRYGYMETQNKRNKTSHNAKHSLAARNTGGRPRTAKGKARTKTLSTKLSVAEWKIVMKRIADAGKRPSVYLREVLLSGRVVAARTQEDRRQIRMLEGGCNNLNQLARLAHQQGVPSVRERLLLLLDEFNRLLSRL